MLSGWNWMPLASITPLYVSDSLIMKGAVADSVRIKQDKLCLPRRGADSNIPGHRGCVKTIFL
jgi:hypothetical protein